MEGVPPPPPLTREYSTDLAHSYYTNAGENRSPYARLADYAAEFNPDALPPPTLPVSLPISTSRCYPVVPSTPIVVPSPDYPSEIHSNGVEYGQQAPEANTNGNLVHENTLSESFFYFRNSNNSHYGQDHIPGNYQSNVLGQINGHDQEQYGVYHHSVTALHPTNNQHRSEGRVRGGNIVANTAPGHHHHHHHNLSDHTNDSSGSSCADDSVTSDGGGSMHSQGGHLGPEIVTELVSAAPAYPGYTSVIVDPHRLPEYDYVNCS